MNDNIPEMTLRDYFAAHALQGITSRSEKRDEIYNKNTITRHCYEYADVMLEERKKGSKND